jgi:hypothetical protein
LKASALFFVSTDKPAAAAAVSFCRQPAELAKGSKCAQRAGKLVANNVGPTFLLMKLLLLLLLLMLLLLLLLRVHITHAACSLLSWPRVLLRVRSTSR